MRDLTLQAAGALAILVAIVHGAIAELQVFRKARIEPGRVRTLLRMVWQASTIDWIVIGVLLIAAPTFGSDSARRWIIALAARGIWLRRRRQCSRQPRQTFWLDVNELGCSPVVGGPLTR